MNSFFLWSTSNNKQCLVQKKKKKNPSLRFYKTSVSLRGRSITMVISWTSTAENYFSTVSEKASPSGNVQVFIFHLPCLSWHDGSTKRLQTEAFASPVAPSTSPPSSEDSEGLVGPPESLAVNHSEIHKRPINQYQFSITQRFTDGSPVDNARATVGGQFIHKTHLLLSLRGTSLFLLPLLLTVIHPGFMFKIVPLKWSTV